MSPRIPADVARCPWPRRENARYVRYHDTEWGVPEHDDRALFEKLILDGAQAGLSWETILNKRENYRRAFDGFVPETVARYGAKKIASLLADPGIVRNKAKVASAVTNAQAFLALQEREGSFDQWLWAFVDGKPVQNAFKTLREIPAAPPLAVSVSKELKRLGFKFVGPTIVYAYMQAIGVVNDHLVDCFRHAPCAKLGAKRRRA